MNREIVISTGESRRAHHWRAEHMTWPELATRLSRARITGETLEEYHGGTKQFRDEKKDVGGYVGGQLYMGKRDKRSVQWRHLITLDLDYCQAGDKERITNLLEGYAYVLYSTHSHTAEQPRYRLVMPTAERMSVEDYSLCSRALACYLGEDCFDPSTFQPERLMYWPSVCVDGEYVYEVGTGRWLALS